MGNGNNRKEIDCGGLGFSASLLAFMGWTVVVHFSTWNLLWTLAFAAVIAGLAVWHVRGRRWVWNRRQAFRLTAGVVVGALLGFYFQVSPASAAVGNAVLRPPAPIIQERAAAVAESVSRAGPLRDHRGCHSTRRAPNWPGVLTGGRVCPDRHRADWATKWRTFECAGSFVLGLLFGWRGGGAAVTQCVWGKVVRIPR